MSILYNIWPTIYPLVQISECHHQRSGQVLSHYPPLISTVKQPPFYNAEYVKLNYGVSAVFCYRFITVLCFPAPHEGTADIAKEVANHDDDEEFTVESDSTSEVHPSDSEG